VSSELRVIGAEELRERLPVAAAVEALETAFRTGDLDAGPLRSEVETPAGSVLLMPWAGDAGVGVKLVTLTPSNPRRGEPFIHAAYVLFDRETQAPQAVLDGAALTALRTSAVSGLATRWLANEDASRLVLFGAGVQARAHLEAMSAVRPIRDVTVVSRSAVPAEALVAAAEGRGLTARVGTPDAVAEADLVCTCTTAGEPLFEGKELRAGAHVNAVGSYQPHTREVDTETVRRALVVVETRNVAMAEAGDLLIPIEEGAIGPDHIVADLSEVVRGGSVRRSPDDVTFFESVGMAFEDLAVARAIVDAGS
jgi:ornithine cyclodeaminase/alanine dehydrogenase-like protein (mu-crystallin family)